MKPIKNTKKQVNKKTLLKLLNLAKPYKLAITGLFFSIIAAAFSVLAFGYGIRCFIDHGVNEQSLTDLNFSLGLFMGLAVIMACASYCRVRIVYWLGERVIHDLRQILFQKLIKQPPSFFEKTRTGDLISRFTSDMTLLMSLIGSSGSMNLRNILLLIGGTIMLAITSPKMTLFVFLLTPIVVLPIIIFGKKVRNTSKVEQSKLDDLGSFVEERFNGIRTIQAFSHEENDITKFSDLNSFSFAASMTHVRSKAMLTLTIISLVFIAIGTLLWLGGQAVLIGKLSGGELTAFIFYAIIVVASIGGITDISTHLQRISGTAERIFDLLNLPSEKSENKIYNSSDLKAPINFENITFHYPSRPDNAALDSFNLTIEEGENIAFVGPSGAGKSTIFDLLLKFYITDRGQIKLNNIDLNSLSTSQIRDIIGVVPQDPIIFSTDVWNNITLGKPDATEEEIYHAASISGAEAFIKDLPEGYKTYLGEKGIRLSGGQKQRLAIARAILRDPKILLLDEATNALDAESEHYVQKALENVMKDRTTLVIAHRLSTVQKIKRIVVLEKGRIIDIGDHKTLIKNCPLYARLSSLQFASD